VLLDRGRALAALQKTGALLGIEAPWRRPVELLSLAERQLAEIVSAIAHGARILLLEEPTSALGPREAERLIAPLAMLGRACPAACSLPLRGSEGLEAAQNMTGLRCVDVVGTGMG